MNIDFNSGMAQFGAVIAARKDKDTTLDDRLAQIVAAQADLAESQAKGLFVPLPKSKPDQSKDRSRIKTIRNRLFILGYLESDTGRGNLDAMLEEAIKAFQKEAGLEIDGWVGKEETWPALQELVSFETPIQPLKWFKNNEPLPALRRAVAVRLFVLGLLPDLPRSPDENLDSGLHQFREIWRMLFKENLEGELGLPPALLSRLFDLDDHTRRLSTLSGELSREILKTGHAFILNVAKIELWLMGYRVQPGGYDLVEQCDAGPDVSDDLEGLDVWMKSSSVTEYHQVKRNFQFYKALHHYWIDHGYDDETADSMSVGFLKNFQPFFQMLDEELQNDAGVTEAERQNEVERFILQRKEQLPKVWQKVKSFGARIWDGVRRVWAWFRGMITRVKHKVLEIGTNMSRLIYDLALGSFTVVSNIFRSMEVMLRWVTNPLLAGSKNRQVVFLRDFDNDMYVAVPPDADKAEVSACCHKLEQTARVFAFGCRVVSTFVVILVNAFATGWTAYFGLVLGLVQVRRILAKMRELAETYQQVFPTA